MIKITKIETWGWRHAIRGMRNPLNSWDKSDSSFYRDFLKCEKKFVPSCEVCKEFSEKCCESFAIGDKDLDLMRRLYRAGTEHRKFLRQIFVSMDITAPLYWWKEFDTYKVGTASNSTSTMHTLLKRELKAKDFSIEHLTPDNATFFFIASISLTTLSADIKFQKIKTIGGWSFKCFRHLLIKSAPSR